MVTVLQMNRLELKELINQEIVNNPVIEESAEVGEEISRKSCSRCSKEKPNATSIPRIRACWKRCGRFRNSKFLMFPWKPA